MRVRERALDLRCSLDLRPVQGKVGRRVSVMTEPPDVVGRSAWFAGIPDSGYATRLSMTVARSGNRADRAPHRWTVVRLIVFWAGTWVCKPPADKT